MLERRQFMHGGKKSQKTRRRWRLATLAVLTAAALAAVAAAQGGGLGIAGLGSGPSGFVGKGGKTVGSGHGFGEVYKARAATLSHALFSAKLIPAAKKPRNIALAALGRAPKKVNYGLALKCWQNNGCKTGTGGKLTVAYVEGFGENVFRQMSKMEFILQALTYPQIGKIIYRSAHSDLNQAIADFKSMIAQKVSAIVTYPDFGDAMLPVFQQATKAGIPVSTYAWGYVTGPGKNYTTVVGEDTCKLGKAFAAVNNKQIGSGDIAFMGGFPGNPLSSSWQNCEQKALKSSIHVVANDPTNWDPSKVQGIVAGILAKYPHLKGLSYEDSAFMAQGGYSAYKAAGIKYQGVFTYRTDETALGCLAKKLKNPKLKIYYYTSGNPQIRVALTADMMKLKHAKIPPKIVFPIKLQQQSKRSMCIKGYPQQASASSLIPLKLLHRMYPS
jgi:ABC-type sugar transport system substrate-binding protein